MVFRFDATIAQVHGDVAALNLPFSFTDGQRIADKYEFESNEDLLDIFVRQHLGKQGLVSLTTGGTTIDAWTNLGTLNPVGAIDIDAPLDGPYASLSLGYTSPTDVFPGWGGHIDGYPLGIGLFLVGREPTILAPAEILDVQTWNRFTTHRRLSIDIGYFEASNFRSVSIQATVGTFVAIPEATSAWVALSMWITTLVFGRRTFGFGRPTLLSRWLNRSLAGIPDVTTNLPCRLSAFRLFLRSFCR